MAGVGFRFGTDPDATALRFDARDLKHYLDLLSAAARNPGPLLRRWGHAIQSRAQGNIQAADYPRKKPIWETWEGGKTAPLTYRGGLLRSIVVDVDEVGGNVRVGSALEYAATQQFGSDGPRAFYVYVQAEYEGGKRGGGEQRVKYDEETGYPIGKLVVVDKTSALPPNVLKVLVIQKVNPRPFLPEVIDAPLATELHEIAVNFLLHLDGRAA